MRRVVLCIVAVTLFTVPTWADPAEKGLLIGGSVGQSFVGVDTAPQLPDLDDEDFAWKIYLGYRVWNFFQVEGGYRDLGKIRDASGSDPIASATTAFDVQALGILKIAMVDLFLKGGFALTDTDFALGDVTVDGTEGNLIYGAGVNVRLKKLGIRLEYEWIDVDVPDDLEMVSAGVGWTF